MILFWNKLIGNKTTFTVEARIFHSVCLLVATALMVNVPYNYLMGVPSLAMMMLGIVLALATIYYFSRIKMKYRFSVITFEILNNILLLAIYYYNSGIDGPCYGMYIVSFFIGVIIVPKKQYGLWLPLNILTIFGLLYYESRHPHWIVDSYLNPSARYLDFGFTYIFISGTILLVAAYIREAFNQEHTQVQEKAQILEETNHTKDKLLSVLAHDLKEPLASIQGFLELLADYKLEESERVDIERQLLSRTKDTSYLLANVLAWTKGQMAAVEVKLSSLYLQQTLTNTLKLVKGIAEEKQLEFEYNLSDRICIAGDKDLMQLIVRNLVINAIKFTYPGGKISVNAKVEGNRCLIMINDTGSGIPLTKQSNIFSLATRSTFGTNKEKGAGLGLVLCKEFTELQGGQIGFTSKENVGSTFYVSMPLCPNYVPAELEEQLEL